MIRSLILLAIIFSVSSGYKIVAERTTYFPKRIEVMSNSIKKENVWVFIMAGQSNMAGRGIVEAEDTVSDKRILSINKDGQIIIAKEPLHFYEPERTGLDCGLSFAKTLIKKIPDSVSILIIPTAIGGSSIRQWLGDSVFRNVKLFSNFLAKVEIAKQTGSLREFSGTREKVMLMKKIFHCIKKDFIYYFQNSGLRLEIMNCQFCLANLVLFQITRQTLI